MSDFDWTEYKIPEDSPGLHEIERMRIEEGGRGRYQHCCCYFDDDNDGLPMTMCNHHRAVLDELRSTADALERCSRNLRKAEGAYDTQRITSENFLKRIEQLEAALTRYEWIEVGDRLPEPHEHFLALNRDGYVFESCMCYGMHKPWFTYPRGDGNASNTLPDWIDVTHWMPKLELPER